MIILKKLIYIFDLCLIRWFQIFEKIYRINYGFTPAGYLGSYIVTKKQMDKYLKETETERRLLQAIFK